MKSLRTIFVVAFVLTTLAMNNSEAQTAKTYPLTAKGSFSIVMTPNGEDKIGDVTVAKYIIDKNLKGELEGSSKVDMLASTAENGSGVYVAIENVTATLNGKKGTFLLVHNGTMTKDSQELKITVVPGCSTGELVGLEGQFIIRMEGKDHFYVFNYKL